MHNDTICPHGFTHGDTVAHEHYAEMSIPADTRFYLNIWLFEFLTNLWFWKIQSF